MCYSFKFGALLHYLEDITQAVLLVLQLSLAAITGGLLVDLAAAVAAGSASPLLCAPARVHVEAIRNTLLLVRLFIVFFGLPSLGIRLGANIAALIALSVNLAYAVEILRAGFESVRRLRSRSGSNEGGGDAA